MHLQRLRHSFVHRKTKRFTILRQPSIQARKHTKESNLQQRDGEKNVCPANAMADRRMAAQHLTDANRTIRT